MIQFVDKTDPLGLGEPGVLGDDEGVVAGGVVGHEVVVVAGQPQSQCCLLVHVMIQQNILFHPEGLSNSKMIKQCGSLFLIKFKLFDNDSSCKS